MRLPWPRPSTESSVDDDPPQFYAIKIFNPDEVTLMINIELTPINFILLLPIAHVINAILLTWTVHFLVHQRILGIPLYKIHLYSHHRHQSNGLSSLQRYSLAVLEHFLWTSIVLLVFLIYKIFLTEWILWLFIWEGLFCILAAYYLHLEYDNHKSWFNRYTWFIRARKLHQIHHYYSKEDNFSSSKNYSFGGLGLRCHLADRLMGTFQPLESKLNYDSNND